MFSNGSPPTCLVALSVLRSMENCQTDLTYHSVFLKGHVGPLLFSVYASKLFEVMKTYQPKIHAYADDTQLYLSFKPDSSESEMEAKCDMERCIRAVRAWMVEDKLKLNED